MYIAELVPPRIRGGVVSFNQLMVTLGILAAYIVDWGFAGFSNNWRWMFGVARRPGRRARDRHVLHAVLAALARREGPRGRRARGARALPRLRGGRRRRGDPTEIKEVAEEEVSLRELLGKAVRRMLIVGIALAIFQQIVGINTVIYYAPTILKFAGQQNTGALTQSVFIGCTNVFFTIVAILLLDKLGRRFFLIAGTSIADRRARRARHLLRSRRRLQHSAGWLALACLLVYIVGFAIGLGPVFWLMISEIFPLQMRGPAMAVCTMFNWGLNFLDLVHVPHAHRRDHEAGHVLALRVLRRLRGRLLRRRSSRRRRTARSRRSSPTSAADADEALTRDRGSAETARA